MRTSDGSIRTFDVPVDKFHELRHSVAGGASALNHGEIGASVDDMRAFWGARGLAHDVRENLAGRATSQGGVWGDPPTLDSRLGAVLPLLAEVSFEHLMRKYPEILVGRPELVRHKLHALSGALPSVDVLRLVCLRPQLLRRSAQALADRAKILLGALPRTDMTRVIAGCPQLLEIQPTELASRAAIIRRCYAPVTLMRWPHDKVEYMLRMPSERLQRLEIVDRLSPKLRASVPDYRFLNLPEKTFRWRFLEKKSPSRWRRRPGAGKEEPLLPLGAISPLISEPLPPAGTDLLQWGRQQMRARRRHLELAGDEGAHSGHRLAASPTELRPLLPATHGIMDHGPSSARSPPSSDDSLRPSD